MTMQTEPIGSVPRPQALLNAVSARAAGQIDPVEFGLAQEQAVRDTLHAMEGTGSPVVTDGEQAKPSFATYPIDGLPVLKPGGVTIPFADGHIRELPVLGEGPFRYTTFASSYLEQAQRFTARPVKQAVIAPSALSLLYPIAGLPGYSREEFLDDLADEAYQDIRRCLDAGAAKVQLDFTEGRLAVKLDPGKGILKQFLELNNRVLSRFSAADRARLGVHTCPGGDHDSTHSLDVDYAEFLPELFQLEVGNFYLQLASEADPTDVLAAIARYAPPEATIFIGVTDPIDPRVETPEVVAARVRQAAAILEPSYLGTCDDCGFSPFADDTSTSRETAFAKIRARVEGTAKAAAELRL